MSKSDQALDTAALYHFCPSAVRTPVLSQTNSLSGQNQEAKLICPPLKKRRAAMEALSPYRAELAKSIMKEAGLHKPRQYHADVVVADKYDKVVYWLKGVT